MDQTGVLFIPGFQFTYETKGSKQVNIHGHDEKRGYSLCVATTPNGNILPFQLINGGRSIKSTPQQSASGMNEAVNAGFNFTFAASEKNRNSHYSTFKTMKEASLCYSVNNDSKALNKCLVYREDSCTLPTQDITGRQ